MSLTRVVVPKLTLAGMCLVLLAMFGASAASAQPGSMSEAAAAGDPAASAPTFSTPSVFKYNGAQISEAQVGELELACLQFANEFQCKDSTSEFSPQPRSARAARARHGAVASACGVNALWLYRHKQYEGTAIGLNFFLAWWDVPAEMNNATTSYRTGEGSAHLSDFGGGGGFWYPGNTGYCAFHSNISQPFPEWNDRISSRYRF